MKKIFTLAIALIMSAMTFAQSFDYMVSPYNMKFLAEFFASNEKYNAFSYNEWQAMPFEQLDNGVPMNALTLDYVEYKIGQSDFYVHPEIRLNSNPFFDVNSYYIGIAYHIPIKAVDIYVVPMYRRHGDKNGKNEFQLSINTSGDYEHFYYQGYFDLYTGNGVVAMTEQRFYWKAYKGMQVGVNITASSDNTFVQNYVNPYLAIRYAF